MPLTIEFFKQSVASTVMQYGTDVTYLRSLRENENMYGEVREEYEDGVSLRVAFSEKPYEFVNQEMQTRNSKNNATFTDASYDASMTVLMDDFLENFGTKEPNNLDRVVFDSKRYRVVSFQKITIQSQHIGVVIHLSTELGSV